MDNHAYNLQAPPHSWYIHHVENGEGDMVLVQKEKSYRTFILKKGR